MQKGILYITILLMPVLTSAQYIFNSIQKKDGLSAKEATCIFEDEEGYIWIGTVNGLNRYDGTRIKVFNNANHPMNLKDESITAISEVATGKLIFATRKELVIYDKQFATIEQVQFLNEKKDTLHDVVVTKFLKEPHHLWMATNKGLFVYKEKAAFPASVLYKEASLFNNRYCFGAACIVDSLRKGLWVGTDKGLLFLSYASGQVTSAKNSSSALFDTTLTASLALDKKKNLWISTQKHLLSYYDFATNSFNDLSYFDAGKKFPITRMSGLFVDQQERLWITNDYFKIFVLTKNGNSIILPDQSPQPYKPAYGFFHSAITDRSGNLWLATMNGVSRLSGSNPLQNLFDISADSHKSYTQLTSINNFKKGKDGLWWICKYDGLYSLNEQNGTIHYFTLPSTLASHNRFFDLAFINNEWWCATGDGIQIFNPSSKIFRPYNKVGSYDLSGRAVTWIFEDGKKNIWFATWKDAIYKFDPATNTCKRFADDTNTVNSLFYFVDKANKIWFGFGSKGLRKYDPVNESFFEPQANNYPFLNSTIVYMMTQDSKGTIYAATRNGIVQIDASGKSTIAYTTKQGLPSNTVSTISVDPHDNIWTAYDDELFYKKANASTFSSFKVETGMPFVPDDWSLFKIDGEKLYASLIQQFAVIDFSKLAVSPGPSAPLITNVSVFEKEIPFTSHHPDIHLKPDENFLVIEFSQRPDQSTTAVEYAYKLEGYDRDWVYCGKRQNAAYTNLPDGEYTFLVKATSQKNNWNTPVTRMKVFIAAPFYKTTWFLLLVVITAAALLFTVYRIREKRKQKKYIDKTIAYFANSLYGENSINEICWDIARNCISQLKLEDCVVYLLDEKRNVLVQKSAYGPKNPKEHEIINPLEIKIGEGIVGTAASTLKPVLVKDTSKDGRYIVDDEQRLSELAVPIIHEGKAIGVIDSEHSRKNFFTEDHVKALSTIAAISANKIAEAKAEEAAKHSQIQLLEIKKLLAESQLMALRAQMNPHFVFNCLNSIQECIVTEKYGEASLYLNKFSKLFRSVLNNSGKVMVTLAEEIEVLELYLALEHMRFEKSFQYSITVDEELEADEILIPSMLLQPYVENALWHGLMHKENNRQLSINFKKLNEEIFQCVIDDNGIGRKKALELKAQQSKTKRHVSKGMSISQDRIELLQKQEQHASLSIIDKYENNEATGTRVEIELSTYLKAT